MKKDNKRIERNVIEIYSNDPLFMLIMLYLTKMLIKYKSPYHRLQLSLKIKVMKVHHALYMHYI